jgi:hypothetical protein
VVFRYSRIPDSSTGEVKGKQPRIVAVVEVKHLANRPTSESEDVAGEEMDIDRPDTHNLSDIRAWLSGLPPTIPADSLDGDDELDKCPDEGNMHPEETGEMDMDGPAVVSPFIQLMRDFIVVCTEENSPVKEEGDDEEWMLAKLAGSCMEKEEAKKKKTKSRAAKEADIAVKKDQLTAQKATQYEKSVVKMELFEVQVPPTAWMLENTLTGFQLGLMSDGIVIYELLDNNEDEELNVSGSRTRPEPDPEGE